MKSIVIIVCVYIIFTDHLVRYYFKQASRDGTNYGIGNVSGSPLVPQRGHGIGLFLECLWRAFIMFVWSGAKVLGRETLRAASDILKDIARLSPDEKPRDLVSRRVAETAQLSIA